MLRPPSFAQLNPQLHEELQAKLATLKAAPLQSASTKRRATVIGLSDEPRFDIEFENELPDGTPSGANYSLLGCLDKPASQKPFKGACTFANSSRDDCFSYRKFVGGAERHIPGPERYRPNLTREGDRYFVEPAPAPRSRATTAAAGWPSPKKAEPTYARGAHALVTTASQETRFRKPTLEHIAGPGKYEARAAFGYDHGSYTIGHARRDFGLPNSGAGVASPGPCEYTPEQGLVAKRVADAREETAMNASLKNFGGTQRFRDQFVEKLLADMPPPEVKVTEPGERTVRCTFGTSHRSGLIEALQRAGHAPVNTPAPGHYEPSAAHLELLGTQPTFNVRCGHDVPVPGGKGLAANPLKLLRNYERDTKQALAQTHAERRKTLVAMEQSGTLLQLPNSDELHKLYHGFASAPPNAEHYAPNASTVPKRNAYGVVVGGRPAAADPATKPPAVQALLKRAEAARVLPKALADAHATVVAAGGDGGALLDHFAEQGSKTVGARNPTDKNALVRPVALKLGSHTRTLHVRSAGTIPPPSMSQRAHRA